MDFSGDNCWCPYHHHPDNYHLFTITLLITMIHMTTIYLMTTSTIISSVHLGPGLGGDAHLIDAGSGPPLKSLATVGHLGKIR